MRKLLEQEPDLIVVVGDVNMPEEINRLVTDRISDLLHTPDTISSANLPREGTLENKIAFVGNIMIDTLDANCERFAQLSLVDITGACWLPGNVTAQSWCETHA